MIIIYMLMDEDDLTTVKNEVFYFFDGELRKGLPFDFLWIL